MMTIYSLFCCHSDAIAIHVDSNIFVHGVGPIFLDDVGCRGNETNLDDCPSQMELVSTTVVIVKMQE